MPNTLATVAEAMSLLAGGGAECALFGGWAEELLGLRPPAPHKDIDLVLDGSSFAALEHLLASRPDAVTEVLARRFAHKRAFLYDAVLCEVLLVQDAHRAPFTRFWGETRFAWHAPLLHDRPVQAEGHAFPVVSRENLRKYRQERSTIRPGRWSDLQSCVP